MAVINGTTGNDSISPADSIWGVTNSGDTISGLEGDDVIQGGSGNDSIDGGPGRDTLRGGGGGDTINLGATGDFGDYGYGEAGNDLILGRTSAPGSGTYVHLSGGAGNDTLSGSGVYENLARYDDRDLALVAILGNTGSVSLSGGTEVDTLNSIRHIQGSSQADSITGSSFNEGFMLGRGSADTVDGGTGTDRVEYFDYAGSLGTASIGGGVFVNLATGRATVGGAVQRILNIEDATGSDFDDVLVGTTGDNVFRPIAGNDVVIGGLGNDTVRYTTTAAWYSWTSAYAPAMMVGVKVDLGQGYATDPWGFTDTLVGIENVVGTDLNDEIIGSDTINTFTATRGDDTYRGGGNFDTVDYGSLPGPVTITGGASLDGLEGYGTATVSKGASGSDTLESINSVRGTAAADVLYGINPATVPYSFAGFRMRPGAGNDTVYGYKSTTNAVDYNNATVALLIDLQKTTDSVSGSWTGEAKAATGTDSVIGADTLIDVTRVRASNFNDTIHGSSGNDAIELFASGAHTLYGRAGLNEVRYAAGIGAAGVVIDLGTTASNTGFGGYQGFITKANSVVDTLYDFNRAQGGGGNDTIYGTPGDDTLSGGMGNNLMDGRGGFNWVSYRSFTGQPIPEAGASIDLNFGTAINSWGGTDLLFNIQNAIGTQFDDDIIGRAIDGVRTYIRGDGGNDRLGAPDSGTMVTADYAGALSGIDVDLERGVVWDDGWFGGTDVLLNINAVRGSGFDDTVTGSWTRADTFIGNGGNDSFFGDGGTDTAVFSGNRASYTLARTADGGWDVTGSSGTTYLWAVEKAQFADATVILAPVQATSFTGTAASDILWRHAGSGYTFLFGTPATGSPTFSEFANTGPDWDIAASGDFNADGKADVLWKNAGGAYYVWLTGLGGAGMGLITALDANWSLKGAADMTGDGKADLLFQHSSGAMWLVTMNGASASAFNYFANPGLAWSIEGLADFNADGYADILFRHTDGTLWIWQMENIFIADQGWAGFLDPSWSVAGLGDFNGDGAADILFSKPDGSLYIELIENGTVAGGAALANVGPTWHVAKVADFTGDGRADILFRSDAGATYAWQMDGTTLVAGIGLGSLDPVWQVV